jgi:hypothetical protein
MELWIMIHPSQVHRIVAEIRQYECLIQYVVWNAKEIVWAGNLTDGMTDFQPLFRERISFSSLEGTGEMCGSMQAGEL